MRRPTFRLPVVRPPALSAIDVLAAIGLGLLTAGAALVFIPAGLMVAGALILLYAIAASRNEPPNPETPT